MIEALDITMKKYLLFALMPLTLVFINSIGSLTQDEAVDATQFVELERIGKGLIGGLDISPDGNYLAVASENIWIYNLETLALVERIETDPIGFFQVAWSPNGELLAAGAGNDSVLVWSTDTWQEVARFEGVDLLPLLSIAWSPDSRHLVFPGESTPYDPDSEGGVLNRPTEVYVWNVATDQLTYQLPGLTGQIMTVSWSPDGSKVAAGSEMGDVIVWDAKTGRRINVGLPPVLGRVWGLKWSPDSEIIAISTEGSDAILWDLEQVVTSFEQSTYNEMSWSHDGSQIAGTFGGSLQIWNVQEEAFTQTLEGHTSYIRDILWSPDDSLLVTTRRDGTLRVWDTSTWQNIRYLDDHFVHTSASVWSPDGSRIAFTQDRAITIWDLAAQKSIVALAEHTDTITDIEWSPDGSLLASSGRDDHVLIWDGESYALERTFNNDAWVLSIAWSPNGDLLAYAAGYDVVVRETDTWRSIAEFKSHDYYVESILWSSDGSRLATLSWPDIKVWSTSTWELQASTPSVQAKAMAWSPDNRLIASANLDGISLWDSQTGELRATWNECDSVSPSYDDISWVSGGQQIITVGCAGRFQIWDYESGQLLRTLPYRNSSTRIAWSPDGMRFAISGVFGAIPIWGTPQ